MSLSTTASASGSNSLAEYCAFLNTACRHLATTSARQAPAATEGSVALEGHDGRKAMMVRSIHGPAGESVTTSKGTAAGSVHHAVYPTFSVTTWGQTWGRYRSSPENPSSNRRL